MFGHLCSVQYFTITNNVAVINPVHIYFHIIERRNLQDKFLEMGLHM